jgi:hypothetical protein
VRDRGRPGVVQLHFQPTEDPAVRRPEATEAQRRARREASGVLFGIAALNFICGMVAISAFPEMFVGPNARPEQIQLALVVDVVGVALVFAALGVWALYRPLVPSVLGLCIYVGLQVLAFVSNPEMVSKGLIVKVMFIAALIKAIGAAVRAENSRNPY